MKYIVIEWLVPEVYGTICEKGTPTVEINVYADIYLYKEEENARPQKSYLLYYKDNALNIFDREENKVLIKEDLVNDIEVIAARMLTDFLYVINKDKSMCLNGNRMYEYEFHSTIVDNFCNLTRRFIEDGCKEN